MATPVRRRRRGVRPTARTGALWRAVIERYKAPPMDNVIRTELNKHRLRRRAELGDQST